MKVYLDNAATTPLDEEVLEAMLPLMRDQFGNPSSIHSFGRQVRAAVEDARKTVSKLLNVSPAEIIFTSGGTEADNMAIQCSVIDYGIKHAITSRMEHHAVLHTLEKLASRNAIKLSFADIDKSGHIDLVHLEELLKENPKSFVSLMHANNEIGNLLPLEKVGEVCRNYGALFHSDTVQTMGHYSFDLQEIPIDFVTCAAHKFHGPKGVGFLYTNNKVKINPFIYGGSQERNMRGGTENVYGIVGLAKALEIASRDMEKHQEHIQGLKTYMIEKLRCNIAGIDFNGDCEGNCLYTVLNTSFPENKAAEMLLFNLDINGIAASGGSACTSGTDVGSHVLRAINADPKRSSIRFSFSKYNTKAEIDYCISKLVDIFSK
ncbi:MAG: cysteine desulfurase [Bacteroidetes bacterium]|nr:cysteine desulfurase [Bacteroidota bacterium]HET6244064.1 cysteine desulfurase family protein [Bacteroidia bacterium]